MSRLSILSGDCRDILPTLEAGSVQTCCTSPPYWGLRDYGTAQWEGGEVGCEHVERLSRQDGERETPGGRGGSFRSSAIQYRDECVCGARRIDSQLGLEATPEEYIEKMVAVFREVGRVLRDDGTLWVNMGDSYAQAGGHNQTEKELEQQKAKGWFKNEQGRYPSRSTSSGRAANTAVSGLKPKDLCMMPARLAMALQADGWYLRSEIVWHKPNPMPESVTDRPTKAHEMIYLLAKQERYYYNAAAIAEPANAEAISDVVDSDDREDLHDLFASSADERVSSEEEWAQRWSDMQEMRKHQSNGLAQNARRSKVCPRCGRQIQAERTRQAETIHLQSVGSRASNAQEVRQVIERPSLPIEISQKPEAQNTCQEILRKREGQGDDRSLSFDAQGQGMFVEGNSQTPWANGNTEHIDGSGMVRHQDGTQQRVCVLRENRSAIDSRSRNSAIQRRAAHEREYCSCVPELQCSQRQPLRNRRSVWTIVTQPYAEAHFATFPEEIPKLCILAGSKPGNTVLDPFAGSGTTGQVALELGRRAILIELNPAYIELAEERTFVTPGFL